MESASIVTYKIGRVCSSCGRYELIEVTKREAAFELINIDEVLGDKCSNCYSDSFAVSYQYPNLDLDLLKEWATNADLHLSQQDEELLLANGEYLEMILQVLDTVVSDDHKQNLLIDALCIIVYDNTVGNNTERDEDLRERVIDELNARRDKLELASNWIMSYIKEVVYPQLK